MRNTRWCRCPTRTASTARSTTRSSLPFRAHTPPPRTLLERADLGAGETVVVTGASGGVGSAAIQLARIRGARIIAIAAVAKAKSLLDLGAAAVVDRDEPDLEAAIRDAASGAAVDVAIDVVGGPTFTPLIKALRQGGRYSSAGAISGPVVEFDLRLLIYKDLQLTGATVVPSGTFARLVQHIESGRLRPLLAATYPLRDLAAAPLCQDSCRL